MGWGELRDMDVGEWGCRPVLATLARPLNSLAFGSFQGRAPKVRDTKQKIN